MFTEHPQKENPNMKKNTIASIVVAALTIGTGVAEAGHKRSSHYRSSCDYRAPVVVTSGCYTRAPVYYRPTVVASGWGCTTPVRRVTACDTTVYRDYGYNGYVERRATVCRPVYVQPRPVYVAPRPYCGSTYYPRNYGVHGSVTVGF